MVKKAIITTTAPKPAGPYSHGMILNNLMFLSGQGPLDPHTNELVGESIQEQVSNTLANIDRILQAGGLSRSELVSMRVFLSDLNDFAGMNEAYEDFFKTVDDRPVRTTVQVGLPPGMLVEIDGIAAKGLS